MVVNSIFYNYSIYLHGCVKGTRGYTCQMVRKKPTFKKLSQDLSQKFTSKKKKKKEKESRIKVQFRRPVAKQGMNVTNKTKLTSNVLHTLQH